MLIKVYPNFQKKSAIILFCDSFQPINFLLNFSVRNSVPFKIKSGASLESLLQNSNAYLKKILGRGLCSFFSPRNIEHFLQTYMNPNAFYVSYWIRCHKYLENLSLDEKLSPGYTEFKIFMSRPFFIFMTKSQGKKFLFICLMTAVENCTM